MNEKSERLTANGCRREQSREDKKKHVLTKYRKLEKRNSFDFLALATGFFSSCFQIVFFDKFHERHNIWPLHNFNFNCTDFSARPFFSLLFSCGVFAVQKTKYETTVENHKSLYDPNGLNVPVFQDVNK